MGGRASSNERLPCWRMMCLNQWEAYKSMHLRWRPKRRESSNANSMRAKECHTPLVRKNSQIAPPCLWNSFQLLVLGFWPSNPSSGVPYALKWAPGPWVRSICIKHTNLEPKLASLLPRLPRSKCSYSKAMANIPSSFSSSLSISMMSHPRVDTRWCEPIRARLPKFGKKLLIEHVAP